MIRCVQCDTELVAPERSEYWSDKHACHIWLCPTCSACFESRSRFLPTPNVRMKTRLSSRLCPAIMAVDNYGDNEFRSGIKSVGLSTDQGGGKRRGCRTLVTLGPDAYVRGRGATGFQARHEPPAKSC